jgi:predicted dinucleotide-binding enzyme
VDDLDGRSLEAAMKRVIVLGGLGQFGRTAANELRRLGIAAQIASRGAGGDLRVDANDPASLRSAFRADDVILDAAGPFYTRNTALLEMASDVPLTVVDLNDDLEYAERVLALRERIDAAGSVVLSSASTVSAVAAAVVRASGCERPIRVSAFLAPASRHAAKGATLSLSRSVGRPVRILRDGRLQTLRGWSEARRFAMPPPLGTLCGRLFASADALWLPRIWPTLREVAMYVDSNMWGGNLLLRLAARSSLVRRGLESQVRIGTWLARRFGSSAGGIGYEIEDADGRVARYALVSKKNAFLAAVAPAVLAVQSIAEDRFPHRGLVLPDRHVEPAELFRFLELMGISIEKLS